MLIFNFSVFHSFLMNILHWYSIIKFCGTIFLLSIHTMATFSASICSSWGSAEQHTVSKLLLLFSCGIFSIPRKQYAANLQIVDHTLIYVIRIFHIICGQIIRQIADDRSILGSFWIKVVFFRVYLFLQDVYSNEKPVCH